MLNDQLQELFKEYGESFSEEPSYTINFVKHKRQELNSLNTFDDTENFKKYLAVMGRYIKGLVSTGKYNLAIDEVDAFLPAIERNRTQLHLKQTDDNWYLTILFQKAYAHYQLKDYAVALNEFKALQVTDPQSDEIKKWIDYSWYGKYQFYNNVIFILGVILIFGDTLLKKRLSENINLLANFTGLGLWIIYFVIFLELGRIEENHRFRFDFYPIKEASII